MFQKAYFAHSAHLSRDAHRHDILLLEDEGNPPSRHMGGGVNAKPSNGKAKVFCLSQAELVAKVPGTILVVPTPQ